MLKRVLGYAWRELHMKRDPVGYARSLGVRVGENCHFYPIRRGMFGSDPYLVTLGNNVHVTAGVQFITHDGGTLIFRHEYNDLDITAPIIVGNNVFIGTCSILLPGVKVGDNCVIGAGSVVSKDIPSGSLAVGVPARVIKSIENYLETLKKKSIGCGHMTAADKERFLKQHFKVNT